MFEKIAVFSEKYGAAPTKEALVIELDNDTNVKEVSFDQCMQIIDSLKVDGQDRKWLLDQTEKFCKDKAVYNAIMRSIEIIEGNNKDDVSEGEIPTILTNALSVSFDPRVGHNWKDDAEERWKFYHRKESKIPFDIDVLNIATRGGFEKKTLNVWIAPTGVGKTLVMCHQAAANLLDGRNVLYITMEMAEEKISARIDANLLNVPLDDLDTIDKNTFMEKMERIGARARGSLIVKEYPTASASVGHFRHLLNELALKKGFIPDIIYIDYLNICASSRFKFGGNVGSYHYIKAIAEEMRGLGVERNVPIVSATQVNREGFLSSDPDMGNTSESFGLPMTVDYMCMIMTSDELQTLNQFMFKQLKSRYADITKLPRFIVGVDRDHMRLFDIDNPQSGVMNDLPVMDGSTFGQRSNEDDKMQWSTQKMGRKDFSALK